MATQEELTLLIRLRDELTKPAQQMRQALAGIGASVAGVALGFGAFQIARTAVTHLTDTVKEAFTAAQTYNQIQAQTNTVIRSTAGAAGLEAAQIKELADALESVTGFT